MNKREILELLDNRKPGSGLRVDVCASVSSSTRVRWRMAKPI